MAESVDAERKRLDFVRNERLKLSATYLNGLAIALFAVGSFGPVVALALATGSAAGYAGAIAAICAIASAALHYAATRVLGGLRA